MSNQHATSASALDAKYWKHDVITLNHHDSFILAIDEAVNINGFEVVSYSCTTAGGQLIYSALMRRPPTAEECAMIAQDKIVAFEAGLEGHG